MSLSLNLQYLCIHNYLVCLQCNAGCCVQDCQWSAWTWDSCSVTCGDGGGQRLARRRVLREAECGGQACDPEAGTRTEPCSTATTCPCSWGPWDNWSIWSTGVFDLFRGVMVSTLIQLDFNRAHCQAQVQVQVPGPVQVRSQVMSRRAKVQVPKTWTWAKH